MTESMTSAQLPKKLGKLFKWIRIFFLVYIISEILMIIGSCLMLNNGSIMFGPRQPFTTGDLVSALGGLLLLISFITSVVLFSIFSYRAIKNLDIFEVKGVDMTPGWSVGWYFIPIANLWKPYQAMIDMWIGSIYPDDPYSDTPKTMPLWWGCWLISNIVGNVSFRMGIDAGLFEDYASNVPQYKITLMLDIVSGVTGIIAAWLIVNVLKSIAEAQDLRIQNATLI